MNIYRLLCLALSCLFLAGCADVEIPKTRQLLKQPLGEGSLKVGMNRDRVVSVYGEPDMKGTVISDKWAHPREEWIYRARISGLPVGAGHLAEDLYLYFDDENLTNISRKPLGKREMRERRR